MTDKIQNFHLAVEQLINAKLATFKQMSLDKANCVSIYQKIFETLTELFQNVQAPISNEGANYIAQQYYDGIMLVGSDGNTHELDPNIFNQRASLDNIPTKELAFMAMLLAGTDHRVAVLEAIKQRS